MKIFSLKKITLFDGDQEELFALSYSIKCPVCHKSIQFTPFNCHDVSGLSDEILSGFLPKLKGLKTREMNGLKIYKIDELSLCYSHIGCSYCNTECVGVFGLGEYQPARFVFKIVSLLSLK